MVVLSSAWLLGGPAGAAEAVVKKTALDDYVARRDPSYGWKLVKTIPGEGVTTFVLDLKSQTWAAPSVDRTLWQHWLVIVKPDKVKHDTAFLRIGGGRNGRAAPERAEARSVQMAQSTGSVVAELGMVPNQPLMGIGASTRISERSKCLACSWWSVPRKRRR